MVISEGSKIISSSAEFSGAEHDLVAAAEEGLDRRLFAGDAGDDDLTVLGRGLAAHHDEVAVEDAALDHRIAADPQHEEVAVAGEVFGDGHGLFDVLGREHAGSGRDVADEGDVAHRPPVDRRAARGLVGDLERARLRGVAVDVALVLQGAEVGVDRGRRREADGLADLADARRVAAPADLGVDELENLTLAFGETRTFGGHVRKVTRSRVRSKHPFAFRLDIERMFDQRNCLTPVVRYSGTHPGRGRQENEIWLPSCTRSKRRCTA
jgi:hypothetical protein